jgi:hypothetical protein
MTHKISPVSFLFQAFFDFLPQGMSMDLAFLLGASRLPGDWPSNDKTS